MEAASREGSGLQYVSPPALLQLEFRLTSNPSPFLPSSFPLPPSTVWMSKDGLLMTGTNGSQLWDASFIAQALSESSLGLLPQNHASTLSLLDWLDKSQIRENPKHYESAYRHKTKGAWPFSTREQGYTVSDCTAEGLKSVMLLQEMPCVPLSFPPSPSFLFADSPLSVDEQPPPHPRPLRPPLLRRRRHPQPPKP